MTITLRQIFDRTSVRVVRTGVYVYHCTVGEGFTGDNYTGKVIEDVCGLEIGSSKSKKDFIESVYKFLNK